MNWSLLFAACMGYIVAVRRGGNAAKSGTGE
jgi:hypothetical protein